MAEDVILRFETLPGRSPQLDVVARALEAWAEALQTAAEIIEPGSVPSIELIGVEPGSQIYRVAIRKVQELGALISAGAAEYPQAAKAAISISTLITGAVIGVGAQVMFLPDPRIPPDQMKTFEKHNQLLEESNELQRKNMEFYGILQEEPAFGKIQVLDGRDRKQLFEVPRGDFAGRAGLWADDHSDTPTPRIEKRTATWDVTLMKPVLQSEPRRWVFVKDGIKFSALMSDKAVLQAIRDKTLPIQVAEGISMKIEVQYNERFDGNAWIPVDASRKVTRVLHPAPPSHFTPLFPNAGTQ